MADQPTEVLVQSEKFVVRERETLGDVLAEQNLAATNGAAKSKTAQEGKIIPAQILVTVTVTGFQHSRAGIGGGLKVGKFTFPPWRVSK
jgi:curli biogenesis system outer membrane secretion channel CsgG